MYVSILILVLANRYKPLHNNCIVNFKTTNRKENNVYVVFIGSFAPIRYLSENSIRHL